MDKRVSGNDHQSNPMASGKSRHKAPHAGAGSAGEYFTDTVAKIEKGGLVHSSVTDPIKALLNQHGIGILSDGIAG